MYKIVNTRSKKLFYRLIKEGKVKEHLDLLKNHHLETYKHSLRVGLLSIDLGYENSLKDYELKLLGYAGLLHDIGKLRIPREILSKHASLNAEEVQIMKGHCRLGFLEAKDIRCGNVKEIINAHHEYKPCPYPRNGMDRRKGMRSRKERRGYEEMISRLAQIVAVADIYDALVSRRAYKPALPKERVRRILKKYYTGDEKYARQILER